LSLKRVRNSIGLGWESSFLELLITKKNDKGSGEEFSCIRKINFLKNKNFLDDETGG
jgi:hypothetical protein